MFRFLGQEIETFLFLFVLVLESRQLFWSRTRDVPCFFGLDINTIFFSLFFKQLKFLRTLSVKSFSFVRGVHLLN